MAGIGTFAGLVIGWAILPPGRVSASHHSQLTSFRRVLRNRPVIVNIASYFGHLWEVFSNRVWIVTFLVFAEASPPGAKVVKTIAAYCMDSISTPSTTAPSAVSPSVRRRYANRKRG